MAGTGITGILITFVGGPILITVLATILIAPQTEQYEAFMKYIKNLAAEVKS